jgi:hypothetical protein
MALVCSARAPLRIPLIRCLWREGKEKQWKASVICLGLNRLHFVGAVRAVRRHSARLPSNAKKHDKSACSPAGRKWIPPSFELPRAITILVKQILLGLDAF